MIDAAADDEGGIKSGGVEHGRDHGSGGGFAVRSGHGDAVFQAHELGQHFGARDHRNFQVVRFEEFDVVGFHGRGNYDHVRARNVGRFVAFENGRAHFAQTFGDRRKFLIGAGNGIAAGQENFG